MRKEIHEVLGELEAGGEISATQRARIAERLAARLDAPRERGGRLIAILAAFGGVLFGAGILYLIGYNWEVLGKASKLALIFGLWALVHATGYWLAESPGRSPHVGRAFSLLGILCFGGAIALVAQIYHLSSHYPWSILLWWALNVPLLLLTRSRAVQVVLTGLFLLWIFWHVGVWFEGRETGWAGDRMVFFGFVLLVAALGAFFAGLGAFSPARFAPLWRFLAPLFVLGACYSAGFKEAWWGNDEERIAPSAAWPAAWTAGAALALLVLVALREARVRVAAEGIAALAATLLLGLLMLLERNLGVLAVNLLTLASILALVWHGSRRGAPAFINLALAFFALLVVTRYVEYLWSKLEGAYTFLSAGALLLALGWFLERRRRSLMARVRGGAA